MYTDEQIDRKITVAEEAGLSGRQLLRDERETAKTECNGIGAEWMGDFFRDAISAFNPSMEIPADIHDLRYFRGGTPAQRKIADDEFLANALVMADRSYRWFDPRRYRARKQARKYYAILRVAGWAAWKCNWNNDDNEQE